MSHRTFIMVSIFTVCIAFYCTPSRLLGESQDRSESLLGAWPEQFADRHLKVSTDDYAIYATTDQAGQELAAWVQDQIAAFRDRYPDVPIGRGIVAAIEPWPEPNAAVRRWEDVNVERRTILRWSDPGGETQSYSLFRDPYFRESFIFPIDDAEELDLIETDDLNLRWICFITTDAHLVDAFDYRVEDLRTRSLFRLHESMKKSTQEGFGSKLNTCFVAWIFRLSAEKRYPVFRSIDLDLMHLQRREMLWTTMLQQGLSDSDKLNDELVTLAMETATAWQRIFDKRPIECN